MACTRDGAAQGQRIVVDSSWTRPFLAAGHPAISVRQVLFHERVSLSALSRRLGENTVE